jgi:hypothetical protein
MLDKYFIKQNVVIFSFYTDMYCVKMQGWFNNDPFWIFKDGNLDTWTISETLNGNSFFFDFFAKKIK